MALEKFNPGDGTVVAPDVGEAGQSHTRLASLQWGSEPAWAISLA